MALKPNQDRSDSGFKDTIESIVITFIIAFMFRAYVVEAFEIPTGSMAPTLYGRHMDLTCSQCGHRFATESPDRRVFGNRPSIDATCPMCHHQIAVRQSQSDSAGDRIVVQKYLYSLQEPRRWDVVVFKNPENPSINFIKRLVGLPGEAVWVIDGNIYTRRGGDQNGRWKIARKSERVEAQNAVWQPIYHSAFVPLDNGTDGSDRQTHPWKNPWTPQGDWDLSGRSGYRLKPDAAGRCDGSLAFSFEADSLGRNGWYAYSQYDQSTMPTHSIEDVRVAATWMLEPGASGGAALTLSTTARLDDAATQEQVDAGASNSHRLLARYAADGAVTLELDWKNDGKTVTLSSGRAPTVVPGGIGRRVELWYVDEEASVWVDGEKIVSHRFDPPAASGSDASDDGRWLASALIARAVAPMYPSVSIAMSGSGAGARLVDVDLDRDLYYTSSNSSGRRGGQGTLYRHDGTPEGQPIELEADQFFCLGDNSPWSQDGRFWSTVDPWIEERMLGENLQRVGVVPRRLMMGRAFFVYFPAPHRLSILGNEFMVVPNFSEMRMIH